MPTIAWSCLLVCTLATPSHPTPTPSVQSPVSASARDGLPFDELGSRWLEQQGYDPGASDLSLDAIVAERFAQVRLGLFDLSIPPESFGDPDQLDELRSILGALLATQEEWVDWLPPEGAGAKDVRSDLKAQKKTLLTWMKSWKAKSFQDPEVLRGRDLFTALEPKDKVLDAAAALNALMRERGPLLTLKRELAPARLVLMPERAQFVEFACMLGRVDPDLRGFFWHESIVNWTELDFDGTRVIALQYATNEADRDYTRGTSMMAKNPKGLEQHVVQLATRSLLDQAFEPSMEPMLAAGIANNVVINLYGEVDTRTDGDLRTRSKAARSVFIPGVHSKGGGLPTNNADSRWRASKGKDHFVGVLHKAQKQGAKEAETKAQKLTGFVILADDEATKRVVHAPFLGSAAIEPPPAEFQGDYAEFLRAYRAAFLYWLREKAGGKKMSHELFGDFLRRLAEPESEADIPALLAGVYGTSLSVGAGEELDDDVLEGRFLSWLAKQ